ncbi:putative glycosyltransferase [Nostocoides japonicum T1-X7]|uniref:Putative glycosyltransferase n=1 Tax=Nostocoides japonicum T1-X7 TaxID=1194083 RepID=A0A077M657_9MICO|nr:glycosyltransferase [Tetrasphaera japonica]CCH79644.1 putative glycosyltransferase [Tetrasphaera japonica T1-X7]
MNTERDGTPREDAREGGRPLRVVMSSYGSEGDSAPLIALAARMQAHGDRVTLLLEADGAGRARDRGLAAYPLAGDLRAARATSKGHGDPTLGMARHHLGDWARQTRQAAEDSDVVVGSGLGAQACHIAARAARRPFVGVTMFPIVPTREFSSPLALLPVPRVLNRPTHSLIQHLLWTAFGHRLRPLCREWGVGMPRLRFDDHPTLCAASPTLLPTPRDWPPVARVVGELREPRDPTRSPVDGLDPELLAFLEEGPAPVSVGFGSMTVRDPGRVRAAVLGLARTHRVLFSPGWSGIDLPPGPNLRVIGHTPHDALFPRMSVVVHHGGAGTLHAAARAGTPQVVIPLGGDQSWWAGRAQTAGIAPPPLRMRTLTAESLTRAVLAALALEPRAREISLRMAREDGCDEVDLAVHGAARTGGARPHPRDH